MDSEPGLARAAEPDQEKICLFGRDLFMLPYLYCPGLSGGSMQQAVGLGVVGELFGGRVPAERSAQFHGDIGQVADGGGPMADFCRGVEPFGISPPNTV